MILLILYRTKITYMENSDLYLFFKKQLSEWPLAAANYKKLEELRTKEIQFDGFSFKILYNPARAVSSLAKLDLQSIGARACFLCKKNRPAEQISINYKDKYDILVNPYPICPIHFVVADKNHKKQSIEGRFGDLIELAQLFSDFVVLFNGAKAGASAPDHFHFQLANKSFFQNDIDAPMLGLITKDNFKSGDSISVQKHLQDYFSKFNEENANVFCEYKNGEWNLSIFPRIKHRPNQFFTGEILISPGAIDMTGNLIVAREEDFSKVNKEVLIDVFRQVSGRI